LKHWAFEFENGRTFEPYLAQGFAKNIHHIYPTNLFASTTHENGFTRVAIVRDPLDRFTSLYRNRVLRKHGAASPYWNKIVEHGLPYTPSLEFFVNEFEAYASLSKDIAHHSRPQIDFLGTSAAWYDHVFSFQDVNQLEKFLTNRIGEPQTLPHEQGSSKYSNSEIAKKNLPRGSKRRIKKLFKDDYEVFGRFF
jgi:hypothetical protein